MSANELIFVRRYKAKSEAVSSVLRLANNLPESSWSDAVIMGELDKNSPGRIEKTVRDCKEFTIMPSSEVDALLYEVFTEALQNYITDMGDLATYIIQAGIAQDEGYFLLKYTPGGEYTMHIDASIRMHRTLTAILLLNDNFTGGELAFPISGLEVKLKPGEIIIFPSNFVFIHTVYPVKSGIRYAVVTWFK